MGPAPKDAGPNAFEPRKRALAGKNEFKVRLEKRKKKKGKKGRGRVAQGCLLIVLTIESHL